MRVYEPGQRRRITSGSSRIDYVNRGMERRPGQATATADTSTGTTPGTGTSSDTGTATSTTGDPTGPPITATATTDPTTAGPCGDCVPPAPYCAPTGACVEGAIQSVSFPPWDGGPQSVNFSYLLAE